MMIILAFLYLGIDVPIGGYNHPCWSLPPAWNNWRDYYSAMLDSAVSCRLGYFKTGW